MSTQTKEPNRTYADTETGDTDETGEGAGLLSRPAVARRCSVGVGTVQAWIDSGELPAVNVAADTRRKPRWFVSPEALKAFLRLRAKMPAVGRMPKRRHRERRDPGSKLFRY